MDAMLFSKRLRRLLGGEETGNLPNEIKEQIQNLQKEIEFMTSFARAHEYEVNCVTVYPRKFGEVEHQISLFHGEEGHQIRKIMHKIRYFVLKSEKAIDTFFLNTLQNKNESCRSKELCDDLQNLEGTIMNIRVEMKQLQPNQSSNSSNHEYSCSSSIALERKNIREFIIKNKTRMMGREDEMERVLNLLIEGQRSLSGISIIGKVGVGTHTLASEVYNNIYVKSYFDCRAWVNCYGHFPDDLLDDVLKSVMPTFGLSEIMGQNDQMKKTALGDYLSNKKYFIVLVHIRDARKCMEDLKNILPDSNNGSRILIISCPFSNSTLDYSFRLECLNKKQSWEMLTDGDIGKEVGDLLDLEAFKKTFEDVCQGLPALIGEFRSLLAAKDKQDAIFKMTKFFHGNRIPDDKFGRSKNISQFIYTSLPDHVKPCFIYLLIYHRKRRIDTRQLYQLWIAEGFVEDNCEATAEKCLEEILIRGFIKVARRNSEGKIKTFYFSDRVAVHICGLAECTGLINRLSSSPLDRTCTRLLDKYDFYSTYPHLRSLLFPTSINGGHAQLDGSYISENLKFLKLFSHYYVCHANFGKATTS